MTSLINTDVMLLTKLHLFNMACITFLISFVLISEFGLRLCSEGHYAANHLQDDIHNRRRGLTPHSRRRGDSHLRKHAVKKIDELVKQFKATNTDIRTGNIDNNTNTTDSMLIPKGPLHHRRRRWEETDDWENGGIDYDVPGEEKKESSFEKFAKSWQKHALKFIFIFSVICTICICCIGCCKTCCAKIWSTICWHCKDWRDLALNRDPTFRKARKFADDYGIELDYSQYKKIKKNYEDGFKRQGNMEYANLTGR